jgi:hypothetical protein
LQVSSESKVTIESPPFASSNLLGGLNRATTAAIGQHRQKPLPQHIGSRTFDGIVAPRATRISRDSFSFSFSFLKGGGGRRDTIPGRYSRHGERTRGRPEADRKVKLCCAQIFRSNFPPPSRVGVARLGRSARLHHPARHPRRTGCWEQ